MINKEQYEMLLPYYDQLKLYEVRQTWDAGGEIYNIHSKIFGGKVNINCNSCKAQAIIELLFALNNYEALTKK